MVEKSVKWKNELRINNPLSNWQTSVYLSIHLSIYLWSSVNQAFENCIQLTFLPVVIQKIDKFSKGKMKKKEKFSVVALILPLLLLHFVFLLCKTFFHPQISVILANKKVAIKFFFALYCSFSSLLVRLPPVHHQNFSTGYKFYIEQYQHNELSIYCCMSVKTLSG